MSYSYSNPVNYGPQTYPLTYDNVPNPQMQPIENQGTYLPVQQQQESSPSSVPAGIGGAVVGAAVGGIVGLKKNPCVVDGNNVNDKFASKVYEKYLKKVPDTSKVTNEELNKMLSKINLVKSPDELKALFAEYPNAAEEACSALKKTPDEFLNKVNRWNFKRNKNAVKDKLNAAKKMKVDDFKNDIAEYWDAGKKKFVKGSNPDKNLFKAIKKTVFELKSGVVAKAAGICAVIGGVAVFGIHKLLTHKKSVKQNQY